MIHTLNTAILTFGESRLLALNIQTLAAVARRIMHNVATKRKRCYQYDLIYKLIYYTGWERISTKWRLGH